MGQFVTRARDAARGAAFLVLPLMLAGCEPLSLTVLGVGGSAAVHGRVGLLAGHHHGGRLERHRRDRLNDRHDLSRVRHRPGPDTRPSDVVEYQPGARDARTHQSFHHRRTDRRPGGGDRPR